MTAIQLAALQSAQQGKVMEKVIVFVVLVLSAVGIWYFGFRKPTTTNPAPPTNPQTTPAPTNTQAPPTNTQPTPTPTPKPTVNLDLDKLLALGTKGEEVKALQTLCNKIAVKKSVSKLTVDGDFGAKTDAFVTKYLSIAKAYLTLKTAQTWAKTLYSIE